MKVVAILRPTGTGKPPQGSEFDLAAVMRGQAPDSTLKAGDIIVVGRNHLPSRLEPVIIAGTLPGDPAKRR